MEQLAAPQRRRRWVFIGIGLVLVLILWEVGLRVMGSRDREPIYVAVAIPLTGPQASQGQALRKAVELAFTTLNQARGEEPPIQAHFFDDEGRPETARERAVQIAAGPALAVIGHMVSSTSEAAAPVYREAHLPAVAGTANSDQLTKDNPFFFRVIFDASAEGRNLAVYIRRVLNKQSASVISTDETYGKDVTAAFVRTFAEEGGVLRHRWLYDRRIARREASLDKIASDLKAGPAPDVVLLLVSPSTSARDVVVQLKNRGVSPRFMGGTNLGAGAFSDLFGDFDNEVRQPGYFTDGVATIAPLLFDSAGPALRSSLPRIRRPTASRRTPAPASSTTPH